jgi:hypothetical protein
MREFPVPKFAIGDAVMFEVGAEVKGLILRQHFQFTVVGIHLSSDSDKRLICYDLSRDPTAAYHSGTVDFRNVSEEDLLLPESAVTQP